MIVMIDDEVDEEEKEARGRRRRDEDETGVAENGEAMAATDANDEVLGTTVILVIFWIFVVYDLLNL